MDHLSASSITMFMRCPTQWMFRYVEGLKLPPAIAMVQGSAVHDAAEQNYTHKMQTGDDLDRDTVLDVARDSFVTGSADADWSEEEAKPGEILDQTVGLTEVWHEELAPLVVEPVAVEREFVMHYDSWEWPLLGYIDTETPTEQVDLKTSGKKKSVNPDTGLCDELERDVQASLYLLDSFRRFEPRTFKWHVAVKTKTPATQVVGRAGFDPDRTVRFVANQQAAIRAALDTGVFGAATRDHWGCSPKMCGYWHLCEWGGKP